MKTLSHLRQSAYVLVTGLESITVWTPPPSLLNNKWISHEYSYTVLRWSRIAGDLYCIYSEKARCWLVSMGTMFIKLVSLAIRSHTSRISLDADL
jgi:hypothetical protein